MQNRPVGRVRHQLKFRLAQVKRVQPLTPHLVRVTLSGDDLHDFESASFDDHIKVFFPPPGADKPAMPSSGPNGPVFAGDQPRPIARDFTPRRYDREAGELDIEFALHEAGPAATWAAQAQVGQYLGIGGPRGSFTIPTGFDWHLLIGDETALPAIARRLEELPPGTRVATLIEVEDPSARIDFATQTDLYAEWRYRSESDFPAVPCCSPCARCTCRRAKGTSGPRVKPRSCVQSVSTCARNEASTRPGFAPRATGNEARKPFTNRSTTD